MHASCSEDVKDCLLMCLNGFSNTGQSVLENADLCTEQQNVCPAVMDRRRRRIIALSNGHVVISSNSPGGPLMLIRNTPAINLCRSCDFPGAESFGLYSCVIHGEEKDQSHRAVYR